MSGHWEDHGIDESLIGILIPGGHYHLVENIETGEYRKLWVADGNTVGEAIAEGGNFVDDGDEEDESEEEDGQELGEGHEFSEDLNQDDSDDRGDSDRGGSSGGSGYGGSTGEGVSSWPLALLLVGSLISLGYWANEARSSRDTASTVSYPGPAEPPPPVPNTRIDMLTVFEGVDELYRPLATAQILEINHRYGSPLREGVGAGFRFADAVAGQTLLRAEIWSVDSQSLRGYCLPEPHAWRHHATSENWIAVADKANFICAYQGPMLGLGSYQVRVFVDNQDAAQLDFQIAAPSDGMLRGGAQPESSIGFTPSDEQEKRARLEDLAYRRYKEAEQAAYKRSEEIILNTDCFRNSSVCNAAMDERYRALRLAQDHHKSDKSKIARGENLGWGQER